jgi:putative tryptophan/tyrosine transport system substrate-binding protein
MRRREFIAAALSGAAAAWPLAARTQQPAAKRIVGILMAYPRSDTGVQARVAAFRSALEKLGWSEGDNLRIKERWSSDDMNQLQTDATDLLNLNPGAILVAGRRAVAVLQQKTQNIPVVFAGIGDPVESGLAVSLAHPAKNFTGFTATEYTSIGKMLELLREISPALARAAFIYNPDNPATVIMGRFFQDAAKALSIEPNLSPVHERQEIEHTIESFAREPNSGLFFPPDVTTTIHRDFITDLVARNRLPAIYGDELMVESGGLIFYGADRLDLYRRTASYVDRILRGEKPGDLPIQQPTKYQLIINLKTAKALGLTVPQTLLATADKVIE